MTSAFAQMAHSQLGVAMVTHASYFAVKKAAQWLSSGIESGTPFQVGAVAVTNLAQLEIRYIAAIESSTGEYDGQGLSDMYTNEAGRAKHYDNGIKYSNNMKLIIIL